MRTAKGWLSLGLAVLCLLSFSACGKKGDPFGADDQGRTVNEKTGVVYLVAPDCYAPIAVDEAVYGTSGTNVYHSLPGVDPAKWLYGELGMLLYAEGVTLPSLEQMTIGRISLRTSAGVEIGELRDETLIRTAVSGYVEGEDELYLGWITPLETYILRFEDPSLGICYEVNYLIYQGKTEQERVAYLYCRAEKRFVAVGEELRSAVTAIVGTEVSEG